MKLPAATPEAATAAVWLQAHTEKSDVDAEATDTAADGTRRERARLSGTRPTVQLGHSGTQRDPSFFAGV